jgi:hypothetical protein
MTIFGVAFLAITWNGAVRFKFRAARGIAAAVRQNPGHGFERPLWRQRRAGGPCRAPQRATAPPQRQARSPGSGGGDEREGQAGRQAQAKGGGAAEAHARGRDPADDDVPRGADLVGTAVQAAGELAHIGLAAGGRALKSAFQRLPRP